MPGAFPDPSSARSPTGAAAPLGNALRACDICRCPDVEQLALDYLAEHRDVFLVFVLLACLGLFVLVSLAAGIAIGAYCGNCRRLQRAGARGPARAAAYAA